MNYTRIDNKYILVDYLPVGKTMFDFYIPQTSKCDNIKVPKKSDIEINAPGFEYFLKEGILKYRSGKLNVRIETNCKVIEAEDCEVRDKGTGGLLIPYSVKKWFEDTFIYSYIKYVSRKEFSKNPLKISKRIVQDNVLYIKTGRKDPEKCKYPMEIVEIMYSTEENCLIIRPFNIIKPQDIVYRYPDEYPVFLEYLKKNLDVSNPTSELIEAVKSDDRISLFEYQISYTKII